jgi:HK97 family phage portal protein
MQGARVAVVNGQLVWSTDNDQKIIQNGYLANDIVYSIISLITNKVKLAPWDVYKIVDESSLKRYKSALSDRNYREAKDLKLKALELYTGDAKLNELLRYPNDSESWSDLMEQSSGYKLLTGDKFLWGELLQAGANTGKPQSIHVLPAHLMQIIATRTFPVAEAGYQINYGYIKTFSREEVLHEKYWNPQWDTNGQQLYGLSPLRAACKNIDRNNSAKEVSTKKFRNGGAEGVLYQDDEKLTDSDLAEEQIGALEKSWNEKYGGPRNAGKIVLSGYKVGWARIGLSPVDMQIIDSEKWDLRMLCAIYGVPSQLLNDPDNKTYNSLREAEKALTSRCAMPELIATRESLNRKLRTDWGYKGSNIFLDFDTSVYPELQENEADKAAWMNKSVLTIRQRFELQGIEIPDNVPDEVLDILLAPNNLVDVNSLGLNVPDISTDASDLGKMRML